MGNYRKFAALLALSCFAYTCSVTAFAAAPLPEPEAGAPVEAPAEAPPEEQLPPSEDVLEGGGGEVVLEDDKNVYHIEADTIIIQPVAPSDPALADPENDADPGLEDVPAQDGEEGLDDPLEVEAVPEEDIPMDYPDISAHALDAGNFPFYGSCWVKGSTPDLGAVTLFFPSNYKTGYIGLDNSGRLFNVSNNSWSGVLYVNASGASYTVNFGSFGLPTYRRYTGSSYSNVTLYLTPQDGNVVFPDGPSPVYSLGDLLPYISILLLGGVFVCCMRRS